MPEETVHFAETIMVAKDFIVPAILLISSVTIFKLAFIKKSR